MKEKVENKVKFNRYGTRYNNVSSDRYERINTAINHDHKYYKGYPK